MKTLKSLATLVLFVIVTGAIIASSIAVYNMGKGVSTTSYIDHEGRTPLGTRINSQGQSVIVYAD